VPIGETIAERAVAEIAGSGEVGAKEFVVDHP
jgi:hypothetical protein